MIDDAGALEEIMDKAIDEGYRYQGREITDYRPIHDPRWGLMALVTVDGEMGAVNYRIPLEVFLFGNQCEVLKLACGDKAEQVAKNTVTKSNWDRLMAASDAL